MNIFLMASWALVPSVSMEGSWTVQQAEVIGWSQDERTFAVRRYDRYTDEAKNALKVPNCGYVDHQGKKFQGSMSLELVQVEGPPEEKSVSARESLHVYPGTRQLDVYAIYEGKVCTPHQASKSRLAQFKERCSGLAVTLTKGGDELPVTNADSRQVVTMERPSGGALVVTYEASTKAYESEWLAGRFVAIGHRVVTARNAGDTSGRPDFLVLAREIDRTYVVGMATYVLARLLGASRSPSGRTLVLWEFYDVWSNGNYNAEPSPLAVTMIQPRD